jgi:uridine kinase
MDAKRYLRLNPTKDSNFTFSDSKQLLDYLANLNKASSSLIVKSTKANGIEFILGQEPQYLDLVQNEIQAISPNVVTERINKTSWNLKKPKKVINFRLAAHYAYPVFTKENEDNLFKLLNQLKGLNLDTTLELNIRPLSSYKIKILRRRLIAGRSAMLFGPGLKSQTLKYFMYALKSLIFTFQIIAAFLRSLSAKDSQLRNSRILNPKNIVLLDKLYEPLFKTSFCLKLSASNKAIEKQYKTILLSLDSFMNTSGHQSLAIVKRPKQDIYSSSDLAAFFHYNSDDLKSGIYKISNFRELPLPLSLSKVTKSQSLVVGSNSYSRLNKDVCLNMAARKRHVYISGATGSGKSNLMSNLIYQDIVNGHGLTFIDPHGDSAKEIKESLPLNRQKDVIYFDPTVLNHQLTINLLETKEEPGTLEYKLEKDQITESVISLFRKVFSVQETNNHRIEYILRNSIQTALLIKDSNIFTIFKLLTDPKYRTRILPYIKDPNLVNFWKNELGKAGDYQQVKMTAGITSKIGRYLFSESVKNIFDCSKSTLNFESLLEEQKILICDLSKGKLGEDNTKLIATSILTKLQLSALARVNRQKDSRVAHFLYVDEFQSFAAAPMIQMLSESRKYGLYLTMAEQSPSQQDSSSTSTILANVGNIMAFRTSSPSDANLLCPILSSDLSKDQLINLPSYIFYLKSVAENPSELTTVRTSLFPSIIVEQKTSSLVKTNTLSKRLAPIYK